MELALHLRSIPDNSRLPDVMPSLKASYQGDGAVPWRRMEMLPPPDRIYVGDEFCPIRLPAPSDLASFCQFSMDNNLGLTLLTPVLTDAWLDQCAELFEYLEKWHPEAEVVVNDIGTLLFLRNKHAGFRLSMGRLFNKGFKDPRLSVKGMDLTPQLEDLMNESTFDGEMFPRVMARLSVKRMERDLMPHGRRFFAHAPGHDTSYYFPFGYVTTGRVCWTAAFGGKAPYAFTMLSKCAKPCNTLSFRLKSSTTFQNLIQAGNTVFYVYPAVKLMGLMEEAAVNQVRLVYQGMAI